MRSTLVLLLFLPVLASAQGQVIRGLVVDADTRAPLVGATVTIADSDPLIGAVADLDGQFVLRNVPLGRHTLDVRILGYTSRRVPNVLVQAGQETVLEIALREAVMQGNEVVVTADSRDGTPLNEMASVSARSFSVEESRRYAGAVDDPARLVAAFPGVTTSGSGVSDNAVTIRGNAPRGVLWRLEGVEIPTPSHFAGLSVAGGGGQTLFSGHLLADSDVFTGAFPAEYGNALSGVFDMQFRTGNPAKREHTAQAGLLGLEIASEGPFRSGAPSTYLFNYRYSTLGLLLPLLPTDGTTTYQDLAFKVAVPTPKAGRFELWGLGGLDGQTLDENPDSTAWEFDFWDRTRVDLDLGVGAVGLSHHLLLGRNTYLRSNAAATARRTVWDQSRLADDLSLRPSLALRNTDARFILGTTLTHKVNPRHLFKTGATAQQLVYDLDLEASPTSGAPITSIASGEGISTLAQAFVQSRLTPLAGLDATIGLHAQHVALTQSTLLEPRAGLTWAFARGQSVSLGYGLHSRIEDLRIYFASGAAGEQPNRTLRPTRAHHLVAGYSSQLSDLLRVQVEAYAQRLFDVPVIADSSFSMLDFRQDWAFSEALVNDGAGDNLGVELTVERPLRNGFYALLTASAFRSRARGGDGIWRPTRFDQGYAVNVLACREFQVGSSNLLGANVRLAALGGERRSPIDPSASTLREEVVFDDSRPFVERTPGFVLLDVTLTYRRNGRRASHVWALQLKNALGAADTVLDYSFLRDAVVEVNEGFPLPVLSYAIEW
ncbi:MAG: TonB-dependent receptor [Bacteroidota bacterium]